MLVFQEDFLITGSVGSELSLPCAGRSVQSTALKVVHRLEMCHPEWLAFRMEWWRLDGWGRQFAQFQIVSA